MFFMNIFVHTRECDRSNHQVGVELVINEKIIGFQGKHKVKLCTIYKYVPGVFWLKNIAMKIIHLQVGFFSSKISGCGIQSLSLKKANCLPHKVSE